MPTLHIQHAVTDFDTWTAAFLRFADVRRDAGVSAQRVQRPTDNSNYVVVDLDFENSEQAEAFLLFLKTKVWGSREASPALVGTPKTMILDSVLLA